jgi:DegV family protein with EDD domain
LPSRVVEELGITIIPLYINIGETGYLDGVEITRTEFYQNLPDYPSHPTTGTPGPDRFQEVYDNLLDQGATGILSIHISEELSATVNIARSVAAGYDYGQVVVWDSQQLSHGTGFQVEAAARMGAEGKDMEEILSALDDMASRTLVAASLDTLEFLRRSGRMNRFMKGIGSLIQLKPILTMEHGLPSSLKVRTADKALKRLEKLLAGYLPVEKFVLLHTNAPDEAEAFRQRVQSFLPSEEIFSMDITPVIGAHLGPKAVGFAVLRK